MSAGELLQHLVNGASLGSLYALLAIGYSMVYGILRLINFAHGDIFMIGAYAAYYGALIFHLPWFIAFPAALLLTGIIGVIIDLGGYRPLRNAPRISALISAIGISFFLENLCIVLFTGRPKAFPRPDIFGAILTIGEVRILSVNLFIPAITGAALLILVLLIYKTRIGLGMRAVSYDIETARLMGINVNRTISLTFVTGSILAAIGGIMWGLKYPQLQPLMGVFPGLKAFIAAILGGIGSIGGATLGGFLLGMAEILIVAFLPALAGYRDAFAFLILIAILLVRPSGILGVELGEKA
ncbi:branched-chain amino acid ABC transporter permease [bacterium]|nr:branched-chain amino acid ABC transporter permease [candidate division CSSED10-310 bacterium]